MGSRERFLHSFTRKSFRNADLVSCCCSHRHRVFYGCGCSCWFVYLLSLFWKLANQIRSSKWKLFFNESEASMKINQPMKSPFLFRKLSFDSMIDFKRSFDKDKLCESFIICYVFALSLCATKWRKVLIDSVSLATCPNLINGILLEERKHHIKVSKKWTKY